VLYGLYLVCFQQVYAQLPAVYLQHPFWGDVSHPSAAAKQRFEQNLRRSVWNPSNLTQAPSERDLEHPEPAELMIHGLFCPNAPKTIIPASGNVREPTQGGAHALLSQVR
jgi:hypothetical protein